MKRSLLLLLAILLLGGIPAFAQAPWSGCNFLTAGTGVTILCPDAVGRGGATISSSGGAGTPGGAVNSIQYNNAGAFGGFGAYDGTNATIPNSLIVGATKGVYVDATKGIFGFNTPKYPEISTDGAALANAGLFAGTLSSFTIHQGSTNPYGLTMYNDSDGISNFFALSNFGTAGGQVLFFTFGNGVGGASDLLTLSRAATVLTTTALTVSGTATIQTRTGTADKFATFDSSGKLVSASTFASSITINGTPNQILTTSTSIPLGTSVTLSTPQDIATTSKPTFASITLTNAAWSIAGPNGLLIDGTGTTPWYTGSVAARDVGLTSINAAGTKQGFVGVRPESQGDSLLYISNAAQTVQSYAIATLPTASTSRIALFAADGVGTTSVRVDSGTTNAVAITGHLGVSVRSGIAPATVALFDASGTIGESASVTFDGTTFTTTNFTATGNVSVATLNITTGGSTTISTGFGNVRMSSGNPATNSVWIPIKYGGTTYYVPGFTTNAP